MRKIAIAGTIVATAFCGGQSAAAELVGWGPFRFGDTYESTIAKLGDTSVIPMSDGSLRFEAVQGDRKSDVSLEFDRKGYDALSGSPGVTMLTKITVEWNVVEDCKVVERALNPELTTMYGELERDEVSSASTWTNDGVAIYLRKTFPNYAWLTASFATDPFAENVCNIYTVSAQGAPPPPAPKPFVME